MRVHFTFVYVRCSVVWPSYDVIALDAIAYAFSLVPLVMSPRNFSARVDKLRNNLKPNTLYTNCMKSSTPRISDLIYIHSARALYSTVQASS